MTTKPKIAFYWGSSCGGCDVSLLDTNEKLLELGERVEIVLWPLASDGKYRDIEEIHGRGIDVCFFNGGVRSTENEEIAKLLRSKSRVMIAFGSCACSGGVPGLANQYSREQLMKRVYDYIESMDNPGKRFPLTICKAPEGALELPELHQGVSPLDGIVDVDYFVPGCPPSVEWVVKLVDLFLEHRLPEKGAVIGGEKTLCDECPRERHNDRKIKKIYRPHEIIPDAKTCLLEQGIICCGPATRSGCGGSCVKVNMPCRGCYGAPVGVVDQGAKMLSAVASLIDGDEPEAIDAVIKDLHDMMGTFYQFALPQSILGGYAGRAYPGPEKRKHQRLHAHFVVSYRIIENYVVPENVSQSKNVSLGGMLLTTNKLFAKDTILGLEINLPSDPRPVVLTGRVVGSDEIVKDLVYDTHIEFISVDQEHTKLMHGTDK